MTEITKAHRQVVALLTLSGVLVCCSPGDGVGPPTLVEMTITGLMLVPGEDHVLDVGIGEAPGRGVGPDGIAWHVVGQEVLDFEVVHRERVRLWGKEPGQAIVHVLAGGVADSALVLVRSDTPSLNWRRVSPGVTHTCGLDTEGAAYCWGVGSSGALGNGSDRSWTSVPTPSPVVSMLDFRRLEAGGRFTGGLTLQGNVYCWGLAADGRLGVGVTAEVRLTPTRVEIAERVTKLAVAESRACALGEGGSRYCWGRQLDSNLGLGHDLRVIDRPQRAPGEAAFRKIDLGVHHGCALTLDGTAVCWGANWNGEVGSEAIGSVVSNPIVIAAAPVFTDLAVGQHHSCALTEDGRAYCWGANDAFQLGRADVTSSAHPAPISAEYRFVEITATAESTCALTESGRGFCWGSNYWGQLGNVDSMAVCHKGLVAFPCSPDPVPVGGGQAFSMLQAGKHSGSEMVCGVSAAGGAYCWGGNRNAGLGIGKVTLGAYPEPQRVVDPLPELWGW